MPPGKSILSRPPIPLDPTIATACLLICPWRSEYPNLATPATTNQPLDVAVLPLNKYLKTKAKLSTKSNSYSLYILPAFILFLTIVIQFFNLKDPVVYRPQPTRRRPVLPVELYNQLADPERFRNFGQCENYPIFGDPFPVCRPSEMALLKEAQRIAAEFEYSDQHVNEAVKEFIKQMDEGLERQGTTMSQIPTYVTAVPNGTEKVALRMGTVNAAAKR